MMPAFLRYRSDARSANHVEHTHRSRGYEAGSDSGCGRNAQQFRPCAYRDTGDFLLAHAQALKL
jgi:hypothetical protein